MLNLYEENFLKKNRSMIELFRIIKKRYNPKKVIYPGCYIHITPSLVFSEVIYVDSFKKIGNFFEDYKVKNYVKSKKEYGEEPKYKFYLQDYFEDLHEKEKSFDLVISQYGGFVGQAVKKYLKKGGILVCNDSHGDASLARLDNDYKLIGIYNTDNDEKYEISNENLEEYFILKKEVNNPKEIVLKTMKGLKYTKSPTGYIFKKIN